MMKNRFAVAVVGVLLAALALAVMVWQLNQPFERDAYDARTSMSVASATIGPELFRPRAIGRPAGERPWITDLTIVDLDRDGLRDVIACDGHLNRVCWIRQVAPGEYVEQDIGGEVAGPAHVETVDIDRDGDLDVLVASMGIITPNNDRIGAVVVLENLGGGSFRNRLLVEKTYRVTFVGGGDIDGDGDVDLSVGKFGYLEGEVCWLENRGDWSFVSHNLLSLPGTIHAPVVDLEGDGDLDIVALVSQDWEEIHAFENDGAGRFTSRVLHGSTNKDYGSSGISVGDIDGDGDPDIAYTNGDAFDYATPGARPWHGVQWLENRGGAGASLAFHRLGDFSGAYSPVVVDIDGDGDSDIVAVSAFNDWSRPEAVSMLCFENDGRQTFAPRILARHPTHLVVVDAADMDNDGRVELVTGAFHFYPPYEQVSRVTLWERP